MYLSHVKIRLPLFTKVQSIWNRNNMCTDWLWLYLLPQNIEERKVIGLSAITGFTSQNKIEVVV
jgi:hypothetical protein